MKLGPQATGRTLWGSPRLWLLWPRCWRTEGHANSSLSVGGPWLWVCVGGGGVVSKAPGWHFPPLRHWHPIRTSKKSSLPSPNIWLLHPVCLMNCIPALGHDLEGTGEKKAFITTVPASVCVPRSPPPARAAPFKLLRARSTRLRHRSFPFHLAFYSGIPRSLFPPISGSGLFSVSPTPNFISTIPPPLPSLHNTASVTYTLTPY